MGASAAVVLSDMLSSAMPCWGLLGSALSLTAQLGLLPLQDEKAGRRYVLPCSRHLPFSRPSSFTAPPAPLWVY